MPDTTPESRGDKDAYLAARYAEEYVKSLASHDRTVRATHAKSHRADGRIKHSVTIEWLQRGDA